MRKLLIFTLCFSNTVFAGVKENIQEVQSRLDTSLKQFQQNDIEGARKTIQKAYFEIFENLEGPIRINHSARKSFQMESTFWEIRKMMGENKPFADIQTAVNSLKNELTGVLPALEAGHQLSAEGQHAAFDNQEILPYWKNQFKTIDDLLAKALEQYQADDFANAKKSFQQAQYNGFKNSEMEMAIRNHRSAQMAANINQQFYDLIKLSEQKDQLVALGYQATNLLQTIEEQLPQLPATRDTQIAKEAKKGVVQKSAKDWQNLIVSMLKGVDEAIMLKQQEETPKALFTLKIAYFEQFDESGLSEQLNQKDPALKKAIDDSFNQFFGLMRTEKATAEELNKMQEQAVKLRENLAKVNKLFK